MNLSDRIYELRKKKGISQEELADKIGVSRQAISKWESEQSTPDMDKIIFMSEFFDVSTDYLLKGLESPSQMSEKSRKYFLLSFVFIFGAITGIITFSMNRFRNDEILMMMILAGGVGYCLGYIVEKLLKQFRKES